MTWLFAIGRGLRTAGKWLLDHPTIAILALFALHVAAHQFLIDPRLRLQRDDALALAADEKDAHEQTVRNYQLAARQAQAAQQANLARVAAEQAAITERISDDYQARIADLRARHERLLSKAAATGPGLPGGADLPGAGAAAGGAAAAAPDNGFPAQRMTLEERLIASEQAAQLDALIDWVIAQSRVPTSPVPSAP